MIIYVFNPKKEIAIVASPWVNLAFTVYSYFTEATTRGVLEKRYSLIHRKTPVPEPLIS